MTKPTFDYVEEYMEFIGGHRSALGKLLGMFDQVPSPLSLARYDVAIVESLASQTAELNRPYTDKQAALAVKIVDKYRRQLAQHNVVAPEKLTNFKFGIRQVDRTKRISIENNQIVIRFPYDVKLIDAVKKQLREGQGSGKFDDEQRVWRLGMTEHMLNWAVAIGEMNQFIIDDEVRSLFDQMIETEQQGYKIELVEQQGQLTITNASANLVDYIEQKLGGLKMDNLLMLVDNAPVLGYEVAKDLRLKIAKQYPKFYRLIYRRKLTAKKTFTINDIVEYAKLVNRMPLHVYDQGLPKKSTDEIVYMNRNHDYSVSPKLLVSFTDVMIGSRKESWQVNSEKIFII